MKERIEIADLLNIPQRIPSTVLPCIVQFGDKVLVCQNLVVKVRQELKNEDYSRLASHNFAVNLVSQLELLSKRTVLEFKDLWDRSAYMKVFSSLLGGKNLYKELAAFKIGEDATLVSLFGENWQNEIRNVFEIRNRFVHEGAMTENIDYVKLHDAAYYFGLVLYFYLLGLQGKTTIIIKE